MPNNRIGLIGLGLMGTGMAHRLLGAGFPLTVYNRNAEKARPVVEAGAVPATSPREVAANAEIVISMVSDDPASRGVWLGESGGLAGAAPGTILIESSTVSVQWIRELADAAAARNCELLDAPVTGSKPQAASGELIFLVGGAAATMEKVRPVLSVMSRAIYHLGPSGSGSMLKLVNNFLAAVQAASLAEGIALIEHAGLNRDRALEVIANGAPGSPFVKTLIPRMTGKEYTPNFFLRLMAKDLAYALNEAGRHSLDLSTPAAALKVFQQAVDAGYGEKDLSAVIEPLRAK